MKILHTEWMRSQGGEAKRVLQELLAIKSFGWEPLLGASKNSWIAQAAKKKGIEVFPMEFRGALDILSTLHLIRLIKERHIDVIHSHSSKDSYPAAYAAKLAGIKLVRTRHMDLTKKPGILYHLPDAIITTGSKIKKELQTYGITKPIYSLPSYPDAKVFYPDLSLRQEFRQTYGLRGVVVGALTGLKRDKRPHLLIETIKHSDATLLIAGVSNDEEYFAHISELIKGHENIRFIGYVDPQAFLNAIDIYACPSKKEGVPQSIMQAMLCAKPVVSMDVGSIADLNIQDNILLAKNPKEFFEKLTLLIQDQSLRQELGKRNYAIARTHFTYEIFKKRLKDVYESL